MRKVMRVGGVMASPSVWPRIQSKRAHQAIRPSITKEFAMVPPAKPISLSDIHDIYRGAQKDRGAADEEPVYRKTDRFTREAGHTGTAPHRPLPPAGRRAR
ncbi:MULTISPECIES: hypothetical protein [Dyella]|uniref:Uncharacterized protein n=2 Tax=Dyella TaxID=231454 RepID=A0A4R0YY09_9GAMM|nr:MULTISPECIES: hypothetical protein [Dyella]TBR40530.1 hypothetical protein EYV96_10375 [Dyella terrae]TCI11888.1 hypothetical protein EZM97_00495 [Dyella soli]